MTSKAATISQARETVEQTTLLDLVWSVDQATHDEEATVSTITDLLTSGRVRLTGNFRDVPIETLLA
jgi:hypothetical protein